MFFMCFTAFNLKPCIFGLINVFRIIKNFLLYFYVAKSFSLSLTHSKSVARSLYFCFHFCFLFIQFYLIFSFFCSQKFVSFWIFVSLFVTNENETYNFSANSRFPELHFQIACGRSRMSSHRFGGKKTWKTFQIKSQQSQFTGLNVLRYNCEVSEFVCFKCLFFVFVYSVCVCSWMSFAFVQWKTFLPINGKTRMEFISHYEGDNIDGTNNVFHSLSCKSFNVIKLFCGFFSLQ